MKDKIVTIDRKSFLQRCDHAYDLIELIPEEKASDQEKYMFLSLTMHAINSVQAVKYTTGGKDCGTFKYIAQALRDTRNFDYLQSNGLVELRNSFAHSDYASIDELYVVAIEYKDKIKYLLKTIDTLLDKRYQEVIVYFKYWQIKVLKQNI